MVRVLLPLLLALALGPRLLGAVQQPKVHLTPEAQERGFRHVFVEGGPPVALSQDGLSIQTAAGHTPRRAIVQIANLADGAEEELYVDWPYGYQKRHFHDAYDPARGVLHVDLTNATFPSSKATEQLYFALGRVRYRHRGVDPDLITRAITLRVVDSMGLESLPVSFLVKVNPVNNAPALDLNGAVRAGADFATTYSEAERKLSVAIVGEDATLTDKDSAYMSGAVIEIRNPLDYAARDYWVGDEPPGVYTVESLSVDTLGTSVKATYGPGSATLVGYDTLENYLKVLKTLKYKNPGTIVDAFPGADSMRNEKSTKLVFTGGVRDVEIAVTDDAGGSTVGVAHVHVGEVDRVGVPVEDPTMASLPFCSGAGSLDPNDVEKAVQQGRDPVCLCDAGFEGDKCEIPPCLGKGLLMPDDSCQCNAGYSGGNCSVVCSNHGAMRPLPDGGEECDCHRSHGGYDCSVACTPGSCDYDHGRCQVDPLAQVMANGQYPASVKRSCKCDPFWLSEDCSLPCPCTEQSRGECRIVDQKVETDDPYGYGYDDDYAETVKVGECKCEKGWIGVDCSIECPPCSDDYGTCVEDGAGGATCECDAETGNSKGGVGYAGADCTVPCRQCVSGTCDPTNGTCICFPGFAGGACGLSCNGHGAIMFPVFNETYNASVFDKFPAVPGNADVTTGGLFDAKALYNMTGENNETMAHCLCGYELSTDGKLMNLDLAMDFTGPFCETPCAPCSEYGACQYNGTHGNCVCDATIENQRMTDDPRAGFFGLAETRGVGYTGAQCDVPCAPCFNGTCAAYGGTAGECVCHPGYSGRACLTECGCDESPFFECNHMGEDVGNHGKVNETAVAPGEGLQAIDPLTGDTYRSGALCQCDYMWTGEECFLPCPYPYDEEHGRCVEKNLADWDYGNPWRTEIRCEEGWTGRPDPELLLTISAKTPSPLLNCSRPCDPCVDGRCQADGECLCEYGTIWQGPLGESSEVGQFLGVVPYPTQVPPKSDSSYPKMAEFHNCSIPHPCSMNGEYLNATCGADGTDPVANSTDFIVVDEAGNSGYGCNGTFVNGTVCAGTVLFGMTYAETEIFDDAFIISRNPKTERSFNKYGKIHGGICMKLFDDAGALNLKNGVCLCDNIQTGRFRHPSSNYRVSGAYDFFWQGWAGAKCEVRRAVRAVLAERGVRPADGGLPVPPGLDGLPLPHALRAVRARDVPVRRDVPLPRAPAPPGGLLRPAADAGPVLPRAGRPPLLAPRRGAGAVRPSPLHVGGVGRGLPLGGGVRVPAPPGVPGADARQPRDGAAAGDVLPVHDAQRGGLRRHHERDRRDRRPSAGPAGERGERPRGPEQDEGWCPERLR